MNADEAPELKTGERAPLPEPQEQASVSVSTKNNNDGKLEDQQEEEQDKEEVVAAPTMVPEQAPLASSSSLSKAGPEAACIAETDFEGSDDEEEELDVFDEENHEGIPEPQFSNAQREEIAKQEHKAVLCLRVVVLLVLFLSCVGFVLAVYFAMRRAEEEDFEENFNSDADKIFDELKKNVDSVLGSMDNFVVGMVDYAHRTNATFPFFALPGFGLQSAKLLRQSKAFISAATTMLVQPEDKDKWEEFVKNNMQWAEEALELQRNDPEIFASADFELETFPQMSNILGQPTTEPSPFNPFNNYAVGFQQFPINGPTPLPPSYGRYLPYINMETYILPDSTSTRTGNAIQETGRVLIGPADNILRENATEEEIAVRNGVLELIKPNLEDPKDAEEPSMAIYYPIYDTLDNLFRPNVDDKAARPPLVGAFYIYMLWYDFLTDMLPEGHEGIILVVGDGCSPTFTYKIDGSRATFLGVGDLHDVGYDGLGQTQALTDILDSTKSTSTYTGVPVSKTYCPKTISIYPSNENKESHLTNDPVRYSILTALVFLFCAIVFIIYDCLVARRQKIVMNRALASGAIVSSLFPQKVKHQLYEEKQKQKELENAKKKFGRIPGASGHTYSGDGSAPEQHKAIADLYEETTIFFADIAGFTKWSSTQTPDKIFFFLERLYGRFDQVAERRGVFKVETIGDCYVAVTGIPEAQPGHALIMARFAKDALKIVRDVAHELAKTLGEDTTTLDMRAGIHSGPTTAGVLRGNRGRFQLFGDSVNTASRMESTGVKGKIQVSQATADLLVAEGKEHWLVPREDKVIAKGKGEMTTYFIEIAPQTASATSSSLNS